MSKDKYNNNACDDSKCTCEYEIEYDDCKESKMGLAMKIGIGVAAVAAIGSIVTLAIINKKKSQ